MLHANFNVRGRLTSVERIVRTYGRVASLGTVTTKLPPVFAWTTMTSTVLAKASSNSDPTILGCTLEMLSHSE